MAIDRPDDGDTPDGAPARRNHSDTMPPRDSAERTAAYTRYRATVEDVYAAARDTWREVLPGLRSAWEQLKEKYPERTRLAPRAQPDGSWVADNNRKLNPEQNAELGRECMRIREVGKNVIVPGMRSVESEDSSRELAGFERRFKGEDRLKEKVVDRMRSKGLTPTEALARIPDAVRFTFQYTRVSHLWSWESAVSGQFWGPRRG